MRELTGGAAAWSRFGAPRVWHFAKLSGHYALELLFCKRRDVRLSDCVDSCEGHFVQHAAYRLRADAGMSACESEVALVRPLRWGSGVYAYCRCSL